MMKPGMGHFNHGDVSARGLCSMLHPSAKRAGNRAKLKVGDSLVV